MHRPRLGKLASSIGAPVFHQHTQLLEPDRNTLVLTLQIAHSLAIGNSTRHYSDWEIYRLFLSLDSTALSVTPSAQTACCLDI